MTETTAPTILVIDDEKDLRNLLQRELKLEGYKVKTLEHAINLNDYLSKEHVDIILLDIVLPQVTGLQALQQIKPDFPDITVIMLTGNATVDSAIQAMKLGAYDYITKPYRFEELIATIQRAYVYKCTQYTSDLLRREIAFKDSLHYEMIGQSQALQKVFTQIAQVVQTDSLVLIEGGSGTGKELVAQAIHKNSTRRDRSFIGINCGSLASATLHSELFGYEKGAFTGAFQRKLGLFEVTNGGTIFLDEIGDMLLENQIHLLRAIETRKIRRLGGLHDLDVDIRIIAATNKNLMEEVREKRFREDLYYRLNVFRICVPPLSERKDDIPLLVYHFLNAMKIPGKPITDIHPLCLEYLQEYDWPGNIRELKNVVERAMIIATHPVLTIEDFPELRIPGTASSVMIATADLTLDRSEPLPAGEKILSMAEVEKNHIAQVLAYFNGNRSKTAKALKISPRSLYDKIARYNLIAT